MSQSSGRTKDSLIKNIEGTWNLESLNVFLDHPVSFVDPTIKSSYASVILKPEIYSHHLLRKLWAICRTTKVSPIYVRRLLAIALIERLEEPKSGRVKILSIALSDVDKVKEKLVCMLSRVCILDLADNIRDLARKKIGHRCVHQSHQRILDWKKKLKIQSLPREQHPA
jgi:hypothetical protein